MLQRCTFWFNSESEYKGTALRGACFHPNAKWLAENDNMACKGGGIEIYSVADYLDWSTHIQPSMLLHELSHHLHHTLRKSEQGNQSWTKDHFGKIRASPSAHASASASASVPQRLAGTQDGPPKTVSGGIRGRWGGQGRRLLLVASGFKQRPSINGVRVTVVISCAVPLCAALC